MKQQNQKIIIDKLTNKTSYLKFEISESLSLLWAVWGILVGVLIAIVPHLNNWKLELLLSVCLLDVLLVFGLVVSRQIKKKEEEIISSNRKIDVLYDELLKI